VIGRMGAAIPHELRELEQFLVWRWATTSAGKRTKQPVDPHTGDLASTTNPATWGSYEEAATAIETFDCPGIGFVFTRQDPYCGVDLDGCRGPQSGEIEEWAKKIIGELDSYSEVSPSGAGVHIIAKGTLPPGGRKSGRFECYDSGRFFTITGGRLEGTPYKIMERSEELRRLHRQVFGENERASNEHGEQRNGLSDHEIIARAMREANGGEFAKLWSGESNGHPSASEADLALCSQLAFWTGGEPEAMDRLFRQSGLFRPKWDERHFADGRTYGRATIEKALEGTRDFYDPESLSLHGDGIRDGEENGQKNADDRPRLRSVRFNEIPDPEPRRYLLEGLIPQGYPTLLHGEGGSAKSMLALSLGLAVARKAEKE
jgi:putative DNA primase/helicase